MFIVPLDVLVKLADVVLSPIWRVPLQVIRPAFIQLVPEPRTIVPPPVVSRVVAESVMSVPPPPKVILLLASVTAVRLKVE
jgi:hypothetical protein